MSVLWKEWKWGCLFPFRLFNVLLTFSIELESQYLPSSVCHVGEGLLCESRIHFIANVLEPRIDLHVNVMVVMLVGPVGIKVCLVLRETVDEIVREVLLGEAETRLVVHFAVGGVLDRALCSRPGKGLRKAGVMLTQT